MWLHDFILLFRRVLNAQAIPESFWVDMLGTPPKSFSIDILGRPILHGMYAEKTVNIFVISPTLVPWFGTLFIMASIATS